MEEGMACGALSFPDSVCPVADVYIYYVSGIINVLRYCFYIYSPHRIHSVESPSMVDPQWNIWYWGSKWNLHTVCWSAFGCEWGTTFVYFGITYVCFIPVFIFLSLLLSPSTYFNILYFCEKYHLNYTYKIFKKINVSLKFEWGL